MTVPRMAVGAASPGGTRILAESSPLIVAGSTGQHRITAARAIRPAETLLTVGGVRMRIASRYSVQIDDNVHLNPPAGAEYLGADDSYIWRYLNHSCRPNAYFRGLDVIALRGIASGEDVTFDYDSTEYDMAEPFVCQCGEASCRKIVRGFRYLDSTAREQLRPHLARHLWVHLDPAGLASTLTTRS